MQCYLNQLASKQLNYPFVCFTYKVIIVSFSKSMQYVYIYTVYSTFCFWLTSNSGNHSQTLGVNSLTSH